MMTYQEQIKHPKWQKKRLQVLQAHKFKCQSCGTKTEELHVHHPYYKRGAMIWEYKKEELECLCHRCHKDAHAIDEKIKKALAICREKEKVLAYIVGLGEHPKPVICRAEPIPKPNPYAYDHYQQYDAMAPTSEEAESAAEAFFARMRAIMGPEEENKEDDLSYF